MKNNILKKKSTQWWYGNGKRDMKRREGPRSKWVNWPLQTNARKEDEKKVQREHVSDRRLHVQSFFFYRRWIKHGHNSSAYVEL